MTVADLQDRMSYAEFLEWMEFYSREPWGEYRSDIRNAMLCSLTANIHRRPGSGAFRMDEFIPKFGEKKSSQISLREYLLSKVRQGAQDES